MRGRRREIEVVTGREREGEAVRGREREGETVRGRERQGGRLATWTLETNSSSRMATTMFTITSNVTLIWLLHERQDPNLASTVFYAPCSLDSVYTGTSLIRNIPLLGAYSRIIPGVGAGGNLDVGDELVEEDGHDDVHDHQRRQGTVISSPFFPLPRGLRCWDTRGLRCRDPRSLVCW